MSVREMRTLGRDFVELRSVISQSGSLTGVGQCRQDCDFSPTSERWLLDRFSSLRPTNKTPSPLRIRGNSRFLPDFSLC